MSPDVEPIPVTLWPRPVMAVGSGKTMVSNLLHSWVQTQSAPRRRIKLLIGFGSKMPGKYVLLADYASATDI